MEGCGSSETREFICVKEELTEYLPSPGPARGPGVAQVKVEPQNEQHTNNLKEEECGNAAEWVTGIKAELSCSDRLDCGVSEAAILAGLYTDHEVKDEVVLGLECPHRPDVKLVVRKGIRDKRPRNCRVRLARIPSNNKQTTTQDTTNHANAESNEEEIYSRVDRNKEPTCDLCGECFTLQSDLVKHIVRHIHVPTTKDESGQDVADYAFAGQCKQDLAQERALCRKYLFRDCCVRLERLHSDALLAGNRRATPATRTTIQGDTGSDTDDDTYHTVDCEKEPTCDICGKSFALQSDLKKHVMIHIHMPTAHEQSPAATIQSDRLADTEEEIDISSDCEKEPACDICGAKFALYSNLMKHVMIHSVGTCTKRPRDTGEFNMYVCDTCGKAFQQKYYLKRHIQNKHLPTSQEPYSSGACGKRVKIKKSREKHIRTHAAEKLYSCNKCQKRFSNATNLKIHMVKPYSCKVCNKSFRHKRGLLLHERAVSEKPYSCTICRKRFSRLGILINHRSTHTEELPYCCTICNKRFKLQSSLSRHTVIHTFMPYSCTICNKGFTHFGYLKTHSRIHIGRYPCETCGDKFRSEEDLRNHVIIVHAGDKLNIHKEPRSRRSAILND